jgi:hypothetical protein
MTYISGGVFWLLYYGLYGDLGITKNLGIMRGLSDISLYFFIFHLFFYWTDGSFYATNYILRVVAELDSEQAMVLVVPATSVIPVGVIVVGISSALEAQATTVEEPDHEFE